MLKQPLKTQMIILLLGSCYGGLGHANEFKRSYQQTKSQVTHWLFPQDEQVQQIVVTQLQIQDHENIAVKLPTVGIIKSTAPQLNHSTTPLQSASLMQAIQFAVSAHPVISQQLATMNAQAANIDVAEASYYPQLSGGFSTGDMTSGERGQRLFSLSATQRIYDFGQTKTNIDLQQTQLAVEQAQLLSTLDDLALEVATAIVNINRSQKLVEIAKQQISGIERITEITQLRANAGLSSQADPVQAMSYLESAQANLIEQQSLLAQYQLQLQSLIGEQAFQYQWQIPNDLIQHSALFDEPEFHRIPKLMQSQLEIQVAEAQKQQAKLSRYPVLNLKGSISQAINGRNPNNNEDNGKYSAIMLEANSNFFQGGAVNAQIRSASYVEAAAKAKLNADYLDILEQIQISREQISKKQQQMDVLLARQALTIRTKALYQEQYKLGTRTALDLLNAEQSIHSATSEIENARYEIYRSLVQYIAATGRSRSVYGLDHQRIHGVEIQP